MDITVKQIKALVETEITHIQEDEDVRQKIGQAQVLAKKMAASPPIRVALEKFAKINNAYAKAFFLASFAKQLGFDPSTDLIKIKQAYEMLQKSTDDGQEPEQGDEPQF